jgi:antitoxin ParD1/3/4
METMNIALPPTMKNYVQAQVEGGGYSSVSEYVRQLIREDQERKAREEIDRKLLEALDGAPATPWTSKDLETLKRRVRQRHPRLRDKA